MVRNLHSWYVRTFTPFGQLLVLGLFVVAVLVAVVVIVPGSEQPAPAQPPASSPPLYPSAGYESERVAQGLARAIVHVVATVPDPNTGIPRIKIIAAEATRVTGCTVTSSTLRTAPTRAKAEETAAALPGSTAIERVQYEVQRSDRFAVISVEVSCPGGL